MCAFKIHAFILIPFSLNYIFGTLNTHFHSFSSLLFMYMYVYVCPGFILLLWGSNVTPFCWPKERKIIANSKFAVIGWMGPGKNWFSEEEEEKTRPHFKMSEKWNQVYEENAPRNEWIIKVSVCHFISLCAFLWFVFFFLHEKTHTHKNLFAKRGKCTQCSYIFPEIILQKWDNFPF